MRTKLLKPNNPLLRQVSEVVNFAQDRPQDIIKEMSDVLQGVEEGVALSACQIGILKRIFIISGKFFPEINTGRDQSFINPEIIKISRKSKLCEEGCLSIPSNFGLVRRFDKITIKAQNENGQEKVWNVDGILAQIFQHEIDHLEGILFIDQAEKIWQMDSK